MAILNIMCGQLDIKFGLICEKLGSPYDTVHIIICINRRPFNFRRVGIDCVEPPSI